MQASLAVHAQPEPAQMGWDREVWMGTAAPALDDGYLRVAWDQAAIRVHGRGGLGGFGALLCPGSIPMDASWFQRLERCVSIVTALTNGLSEREANDALNAHVSPRVLWDRPNPAWNKELMEAGGGGICASHFRIPHFVASTLAIHLEANCSLKSLRFLAGLRWILPLSQLRAWAHAHRIPWVFLASAFA